MENMAMKILKIERVLSNPTLQVAILAIIIAVSLIIIIIGTIKTTKELKDCYYLIHGKKISKKRKKRKIF